MPHEIHVSERRSFRGCKRRWNWAYREGYVPEVHARPLEFGIAYHKAMEVIYDPATWSTKPEVIQRNVDAAVALFQDECNKQKKNYFETVDAQDLPADVDNDYYDRLRTGEGMLRYYGSYVIPKFDGWFKPVATEISFSVPIADPFDVTGAFPLQCHNSPMCGQHHPNEGPGSEVVYAGRVDLLVEDMNNGGYFIWDHKTAATLTPDSKDGFLQLDDQVGSYVWAVRNKLEIDVRGFIYAESRKDFPQEPKLLKRSMGGRLFSTSKTQATSLEIFEPYVQKHDPLGWDEGSYADYLRYLESAEATQYHQRFVIVKSEYELEEIGRVIALEAMDMVRPDLLIYPSVGRFTCSTCAYRAPCVGAFQGEDVDWLLESNYKKTDRRYWMEQQRSSEKRQ